MSDLSMIVIGGRMVRDAEYKTLASGLNLASFTVATSVYGGKEKKALTEYYDCIAWSKLADYVTTYCGKGAYVTVNGIMRSSSYEKDGVKRKAWKIQVGAISCITKPSGASTPGAPSEEPPGIDDDVPF